VANVLLYSYFLVSLALTWMGAVYFVRVSRGIAVLGGNGMPTPKWLHAFVFGFGVLGVLASAPSIFTGNPHWFVDKIYFVVSRIIAVVA
jgi:hypothetical protein